MRRKGAGWLVLPLVLAMAGPTGAYPQKGRGPHEHCGDRFDPKTMTTLKVEILYVQAEAQERGHEAVHLRVKAAGGEVLTVMVGPSEHVRNLKLELAPYDHLTVTGSRVKCEGNVALIATTIEKDGNTYRLRDDDGFPRWVKRKKQAKPPFGRLPHPVR